MGEGMNAEDMLKKIFQCMTELLEVKEFSKTVKILTELGRTLVDSERASFWFWDKEEKQYWTLAATGNVKIAIPSGTGIVGKVIMSGETLLCNDPYKEPAFNKQVDERTGFVTKQILCIPVKNSSGDVMGAFQAVNKFMNADFTKADVERLSLAVVFCEKTLESYLLQGDRTTDKDTALKNKAAFYEYYNTKIANVVWKNQTSVILGEVDKLAEIRQEFGENAITNVNNRVARVIKNMTEIDDLIAKWDDDKFIIVVNQKNSGDIIKMCERMCAEVTGMPVKSDRGDIDITISFGVQMMDSLFTLEENIRFAEGNLADAHSAGGNRVV